MCKEIGDSMVKATEKQNLIPKVNVSITHQLQKMRNVKKPNQIKTMTANCKMKKKIPMLKSPW